MSPRYAFFLAFVLFVFIYGLFYFSRFSSPYRWLIGLLGATLATEAATRILFEQTGTTFPVYHFFIPVALLFNAFIYAEIWAGRKSLKWLIYSITVCFLIGTLVNSFTLQTLSTFPSNGILLHCLQTILLSLITYSFMLRFPISTPLRLQPVFWFNTGNFFFYGINFFLFGFFNFYYKSESGIDWTYEINWYSNMILYLLYFRTLYLEQKS